MVIELTAAESAALYEAFLDCAEMDIRAMAAPKGERAALEEVTRWKGFKIGNILKTALSVGRCDSTHASAGFDTA